MTEQLLIFKDKLIRGNNLELTFHKDHVWIYNADLLPVVKFTLINCKDIEAIKFDAIDSYNDGVIVDVRQEGDYTILETNDEGDVRVKMICDQVVKEEREYNREEFIFFINEILTQRDDKYSTVSMLRQRTAELKKNLNRELDIINRKINLAVWLTNEKRKFLEGQKYILQKIIDTIDKSEKQGFESRERNKN
jgi:hypothetical protein